MVVTLEGFWTCTQGTQSMQHPWGQQTAQQHQAWNAYYAQQWGQYSHPQSGM